MKSRACVCVCTELSAFPRVRPHPRADSSSSSVCRSSASKDRKSTVVARQEEDLTTGLSSGDGDGRLPPKRRQNGADSAGRSPSRASEGEKTKRGVSHRELDRATAEPLRNNDSDYGTEKSAITAMRCREDDNTQESTYGYGYIGDVFESGEIRFQRDELARGDVSCFFLFFFFI